MLLKFHSLIKFFYIGSFKGNHIKSVKNHVKKLTVIKRTGITTKNE